MEFPLYSLAVATTVANALGFAILSASLAAFAIIDKLYIVDLVTASGTKEVIKIKLLGEADLLTAGGTLDLIILLVGINLVLAFLVEVAVILAVTLGVIIEVFLEVNEILCHALHIGIKVLCSALKHGDLLCHLINEIKHLHDKLTLVGGLIKLKALSKPL